MISNWFSAAPVLASFSEGTAKSGGLSGFAQLVQGATAQDASNPIRFSGTPKPDPAPAASGGETIDTDTPEGVMALLGQTLAELEASGAPLTRKLVLSAFADAMGKPPVNTLSDLGPVAGLDGEVVAALERQIETALFPTSANARADINSAVFSTATGAPVTRTGSGPPSRDAKPTTLSALAPPASGPLASDAGASARGGSGQNDALAGMLPPQGETGTGKTAPSGATFAMVMEASGASGEAATPAEAIPEEAARLTGVQTTPDHPRLATAQTAAHAHAATPDQQLRQHVGRQIRSLDISDAKLRFSLTPYGMGEVEIEITRAESGRFQIVMTTENASVLNTLRQDRDQLLDALQSRGIAADTADLDFQTFDERGRQQRPQPDTGPMPDLAEHPEAAVEPVQVLRHTGSPGHLDILT